MDVGIQKDEEFVVKIIGSVSQWIHQAKSGDDQAIAHLHSRYWPRLVELAGKRIPVLPDRDAEDIAQISFLAVCQAIRANQTPNLENRHQLLAFMTHVIARKAINELKHANAKKRGNGSVSRLSDRDQWIEQRGTPSPTEQALLLDCYQTFVHTLPEHLIAIAELHLSGFTNREIAQKISCVERTIERKLALIRQHWQSKANDELADQRESDNDFDQ